MRRDHGRDHGVGLHLARMILTLGLYAALAGGAFFAVGALWPRYHVHADGQTGMGAGLVGLGAGLLGVILVVVGIAGALVLGRRGRAGHTEPLFGGWIVLVAVVAAALAVGLLVLGGIDAMDGRAVESFLALGGVSGVASLLVPYVADRQHPATPE